MILINSLAKDGIVFGNICLLVCPFVSNITQQELSEVVMYIRMLTVCKPPAREGIGTIQRTEVLC